MDPRLSDEHDEGRAAAEPRRSCAPRAGSATWARASRRRARSPGPTSSTAPGPARTASSTSSTATRRSSARRSTRPPRPSPARAAGRSATTSSSSISGRSTTSRRRPCCAGRATPFWDYLDAAGVPSTFYDLPSNYPPSPSQHGHHRCLCGMGTPDMLGTYGTYQYFAEDGPPRPLDEGGGKRSRLTFERRDGPGRDRRPGRTACSRQPRPITIEFLVHRDREANAAVIEIQGQRIVLKAGQWSRWTKLDFALSMPPFAAEQRRQRHLPVLPPGGRARTSGSTCRPINIDPSAPAHADLRAADRSSRTSRSQARARSTPPASRKTTRRGTNGVFDDDEYLQPGGHGAGRAAGPVRVRASTTTTTACCSSTSPAATSSRTCSGGTPTRSTRSARPPRRRSTSATSSGSTRSSTR